MTAPCKDCADRHFKCHSCCERYKEFRKRCDDMRERERLDNLGRKIEINHPTRYAGGKYECIDVMTDVFGVDATKSFCKLNAFKYLWREQQKNGVQDLKKCAWYLDKLIELSENSDENV